MKVPAFVVALLHLRVGAMAVTAAAYIETSVALRCRFCEHAVDRCAAYAERGCNSAG